MKVLTVLELMDLRSAATRPGRRTPAIRVCDTGLRAMAFAGWMFVTGAVGVCPGYWLVKISTRPSPHRISMPPLRAVTHH
jgi:hypothetical protein